MMVMIIDKKIYDKGDGDQDDDNDHGIYKDHYHDDDE